MNTETTSRTFSNTWFVMLQKEISDNADLLLERFPNISVQSTGLSYFLGTLFPFKDTSFGFSYTINGCNIVEGKNASTKESGQKVEIFFDDKQRIVAVCTYNYGNRKECHYLWMGTIDSIESLLLTIEVFLTQGTLEETQNIKKIEAAGFSGKSEDIVKKFFQES